MPVAEIFATHGEAHFRRLERAAMDRALAAPPQVIAPGAGWIAEPGNLEAARGTLLIYFEIVPYMRQSGSAGITRGPCWRRRPAGRIRELLTRRGPWYRRGPGWEWTLRRQPAVMAEPRPHAVHQPPGRSFDNPDRYNPFTPPPPPPPPETAPANSFEDAAIL